MNLLEKFKIIIKRKPQSIENTGLSKIDTSLIYIPKLKELSESDKEKVLEYIKEIDISNLESIINYASDLNEKANSNTEILMRLYYRLVDETEIKLDADNIIYDKYNALININELNLCKAELLNLREEGILKVIALEEVLKKESSRKLFFSSIFGKYEKLKRKAELNSLMDAIERTKVVIKVIEQLIQAVNINVSSELLKVTSENILLNIVKEENNDSVIEELINETKSMLKTFLPEYEGKFVFDTKNINECIVNLSIAKRLLDLYAYNHKDEVECIFKDIRTLVSHHFLIAEKEQNRERIECVGNKIKLFYHYIKDKILFKFYIRDFYKCKFNFLISDILDVNESPFKNIKNKLELECYYEIVSKMVENIIMGNHSLIRTFDSEDWPEFSKEKNKELQAIIIKLLRESDLSSRNILCDLNLLKLIISLSESLDYVYKCSQIAYIDFEFSYNEKYLLMKDYKKDDIKFNNDEKNVINLRILKFLFKIFACYEAYNNGKEMPYNFFEKIHIANDKIVYINKSENNKNEYLPFYLDILEQSELCIILPGIKEIMILDCKKHNLSELPVTKLVFCEDLSYIENSFNNCTKLETIDVSYMNGNNKFYINNSFINERYGVGTKEVIISYEFLSNYCRTPSRMEQIEKERSIIFSTWSPSFPEHKKEWYVFELYDFRTKIEKLFGGSEALEYSYRKTLIVKGKNTWCVKGNEYFYDTYYSVSNHANLIKRFIDEKEKDDNSHERTIISLDEYNELNIREDFNWFYYEQYVDKKKKLRITNKDF